MAKYMTKKIFCCGNICELVNDKFDGGFYPAAFHPVKNSWLRFSGYFVYFHPVELSYVESYNVK